MQFAPVKSRRTVSRWYPNAVAIVKVTGGFLAFFSRAAYAMWRRNRCVA